MTEIGALRSRPRNAKRAQGAILDAAEEIFSEHGYDGARIDAIAEASGYNKSLIFHYFGDKLGLYTAVIQRAREQADHMSGDVFGALLRQSPVTADAFRAFIERAVKDVFEYFVAHPRLLRILAWEEAEGWATLAKISARLDRSRIERFAAVLEEAQRAGALRPDVSPHFVLYLLFNVCRTYLTSVPILQLMVRGDGDLSAPEALARGREQLAALIVHGTVADSSSDAVVV